MENPAPTLHSVGPQPVTDSLHHTSHMSIHFSCRDLYRAIDFLIDNIFVRFGGKVFRQVIGIPMGTNSAPLLADLFLHTYEYEFINEG